MLTSTFTAQTQKSAFGYFAAPLSFAGAVDEMPGTKGLTAAFKRKALRPANANRSAGRPKTHSEDGMMGGVILDALFMVAFPGLTPIFSQLGGLGATDVVNLYDHARDAFNPQAGRKNNIRASLPFLPRHSAGLAMVPVRRKKSILALLWG